MPRSRAEIAKALFELENETPRVFQVYRRSLRDISELRQGGAGRIENTQHGIELAARRLRRKFTRQIDRIADNINPLLLEHIEQVFFENFEAEGGSRPPQSAGINEQPIQRGLHRQPQSIGSLARISDRIARDGVDKATRSLADDITRELTTRFDRILRTEVNRAFNEGSFRGARQDAKDKGQSLLRTWYAVNDQRTRQSHAILSGSTVLGEDALFTTIHGNSAKYPGGFGIAAEDINCRCHIEYSFV